MGPRLTPLSRYTWSERVVALAARAPSQRERQRSQPVFSPYLARIASNSVVRPTVSLPQAYH